MKVEVNKRLNIFVDETGEFGFGKHSATLSGISLVLHEHRTKINEQVYILNNRLSQINFSDMIHMGDLVMGRNNYSVMTISERRKIFTTLYSFSKLVNTSYYSVIIDKKKIATARELCIKIENQLSLFLTENLNYFQQFDEIVIYYDDGQAPIGRILDKVFGELSGYRKVTIFDHQEKKLFQVADMLTYVDKLIYKYNHHINFSKTEERFFSDRHIRNLVRERKKKDFSHTHITKKPHH